VSALISIYLLINLIGPGIFTALEQSTSHAVSVAGADTQRASERAARAGTLAALASGVVVLLAVVAWPLGLHRVLDEQVGLLLALLVAVIGSGWVYWLRGVLSGQQRFRPYATTFYVEGIVRLALSILLMALGVADPSAYGFAFAAGSIVAGLAMMPRVRHTRPDLRAEGDGMGRSFLLLAGATSMSQLIANIAPVVVAYRLPGEAVAASVFAATFVLARVPLFAFSPILAVLLPKLTRLVVQRELRQMHRQLRRVLVLVVAVGGSGTLLAVLFGPWAVQTLFNSVDRPARSTVLLLTVSMVFMMVALVLQPALVALGRQRAVTAGWTIGSVVLLVVIAMPVDAIDAALTAQLAGAAAAAAWLCVTTYRMSRRAVAEDRYRTGYGRDLGQVRG
jgi:O-antigen/teichoic acid export membrane protein